MQAVKREKTTLSSNRKPHLFLSHNHKDKPLVRKLAEDLMRHGIDVWLDEWEIEIGDSLHKSVGSAIEKSKYIGIAITANFVASQWCNDELTQALAKERREKRVGILPLVFDHADPLAFVEDRLFVDFSENYYKALVHLCGLLHGANARLIATYINAKPISNYKEVSSILQDLGWDGWSDVEVNEFNLLLNLIDKAITIDPSVSDMIIQKEKDKLSYYRGLGDSLRSIFPDNPLIQKLMGGNYNIRV